mmetsp:Transcript_19671/g.50327  ORF Transcript_19671/g.50327 Transcript_19671/m.50327 type:complete len:227 (+) Transcript_19671:34-714(+)
MQQQLQIPNSRPAGVLVDLMFFQGRPGTLLGFSLDQGDGQSGLAGIDPASALIHHNLAKEPVRAVGHALRLGSNAMNDDLELHLLEHWNHLHFRLPQTALRKVQVDLHLAVLVAPCIVFAPSDLGREVDATNDVKLRHAVGSELEAPIALDARRPGQIVLLAGVREVVRVRAFGSDGLGDLVVGTLTVSSPCRLRLCLRHGRPSKRTALRRWGGRLPTRGRRASGN